MGEKVFLNVVNATSSGKTFKVNVEDQTRPRRHLQPPAIIYTHTKHRYRTAKSSPSGILITKPRILNHGPPLKIVQTGPFYVNHHVYCDSNKKRHESGQSIEEEEVDFVNNLPVKIHHFDHNVKISDPSTTHGIDFLNIDLDQNKHINNFDIELPSQINSDENKLGSYEVVTPLVQGTIHINGQEKHNFMEGEFLSPHDGSIHIGGEAYKLQNNDNFNLQNTGDNFKVHKTNFIIPSPHKYSENLDTIVEYLKDSGDASVFGKDKLVSGYRDKTNNRGEFVNSPSLLKHPLETDYGKSTYDTPGATDSYGHPVTPHSTPLLESHRFAISSDHSTPLVNSYKEEENNFGPISHNFDITENHNFNDFNFNFKAINSQFDLNKFKDTSFENFEKNSSFASHFENYFKGNLYNNIERLRRSNKEVKLRVDESQTGISRSTEKIETTTMRYSNHKYE